MQVVHERCAGLDVHKQFVMACARVLEKGKVQKEVRRFMTSTQGLLDLSAWLQDQGCTHVGMEATGVYWKPVWHLLEGCLELVLSNPAHMRNVPGRKSDMNDAMWIAELLAHGLLPSSFVPPAPIQELRDLTRTRRQLVREIVQHTQRIQRVLEDANVKLSSVISNVLGVSGRRILAAMVAGENDSGRLAELGSDRLHCSRERLQESLQGRVTAHHRFLLRQHLMMIDHLQKTIDEFDLQIQRALEPFRRQIDLLSTIPGISTTAAQVLVAEIGVKMAQFPTVDNLLSWAGLCPSMNQMSPIVLNSPRGII